MRLFLSMVWVATALLCSGVRADGLDSHTPSLDLLASDPIHLTSSGCLPVAFESACRILSCDDFLETIQRGYVATLPAGEPAEFTIQQTAPGHYNYVNRKGQQTRIEELRRRVTSGGQLKLALYSEGERFFGPFQSLCLIEVRPAGPDAVDWSVEVYARPDSTAVRWMARVTPVEWFFRKKTRHMSELVAEVCEQIMSEDPGPATAALHTAEYSAGKDDG